MNTGPYPYNRHKDPVRPRGLRGWFADTRGVVAVEFALLAVPFLFLMIGTLEICIAYASGYVLETGVVQAARFVRTGQAQDAADPQAAFEARLCELTDAMLDCDAITYEAIVVDSFSTADASEPAFDEDGEMISQGFDPGAANETILVRASFRYRFKTPLVALFNPSWNGGDGSIRFLSTYAIRNEPFSY